MPGLRDPTKAGGMEGRGRGGQSPRWVRAAMRPWEGLGFNSRGTGREWDLSQGGLGSDSIFKGH